MHEVGSRGHVACVPRVLRGLAKDGNPNGEMRGALVGLLLATAARHGAALAPAAGARAPAGPLILTRARGGAHRHVALHASLAPPLVAACAVGAVACRDTPVARALSPPMLSFALCLALSNVGVLPSDDPFYGLCTSTVLPLAAALSLLSSAAPDGGAGGGADARRALGSTALAFAIGAVGTVVGAALAHAVAVRARLFDPSSAARAAAMLCATYVGGTANMLGVAAATGAGARQSALLPSLLAADLALMGLYLLGLTLAAAAPPLRRAFPSLDIGAPPVAPPREQPAMPPRSAAVGAALGVCVAACAAAGGARLERALGTPGVAIVAICAACSAAAALAPRRLARTWSSSLGSPAQILAALFFGSLGASARLAELLAAGPPSALCASLVLAVHCAAIGTGALIANAAGAAISLPALLVASNANVGGPATAIAMAGAMGWPALVAPAATCGAVGYALGTPLGCLLHRVLARGVGYG